MLVLSFKVRKGMRQKGYEAVGGEEGKAQVHFKLTGQRGPVGMGGGGGEHAPIHVTANNSVTEEQGTRKGIEGDKGDGNAWGCVLTFHTERLELTV